MVTLALCQLCVGMSLFMLCSCVCVVGEECSQ